jgi:hypothetical protein
MGDRINWTTKTLVSLNSDSTRYEYFHRYKAVVDGDTMRVTLNSDSKIESPPPIEFVASRVTRK